MNSYSGQDLDLPGFRFHPTEEELLDFYLRKMVNGTKFHFEIIGTIHLYRHEPPELPGLAMIGEKEWYFFVPRDRTHANGGRPNRTTEKGFWKATGSDRPIRSASNPKRLIGLKKTLVYYKGRAPRGTRTDWVMNEYRFPDTVSIPPPKEDIVICKVYKKAATMKELEERAAMEKAKSILLNFSENCSDDSLNNMGKRVRGGSLSSSSMMTDESMIVHQEGDTPIYSSMEWSQDKWFPYDNVLDF